MTRKQWEDYNSRKEQLVIDGLFAQIAEQRMGTKRFLDDMDSIAKLTEERNRLRELLSYAVEWAQDRGYDLPEVAPEWFLSALKETSDD